MQIFVVDSNDKDRVGEAHDELHRMLSEDELREAVVLVFANKQDLPNAMSVAEVSARSLARSLATLQAYPASGCASASSVLTPNSRYRSVGMLCRLIAYGCRSSGNRQARFAITTKSQVVHPSHVCDIRRRAVRRAGLAQCQHRQHLIR